MHSSFSRCFALGLLAVFASAAPLNSHEAKRQSTGGHLVFAHFMMGIVGNRGGPSDYDSDMKLAKAAGIDAFALNIGNDVSVDQITHAYDSAASNNMNVFISFDFHYFATNNASGVGSMIKTFAGKPAQLKVDGKVFVSSFVGDGLAVSDVRTAAGSELYFAPNFQPNGDVGAIDGALNWDAWDSNGANKAPTPGGTNVTVAQGDSTYTTWLGKKGYIAPVSPWFHTHYGSEVSYPKNWVFPSDLLWFSRWNEILKLAPRFVEILTWNDYGESHYIGPLSSKHNDDGNSKWANDMPHDGWLDMAKPFISAFKGGKPSVDGGSISEEKLVYWYRPTLKSVNCDSTDTTGSKPDGYDTMADSVFIVALLQKPGTVVASSGSNSKSFDAPAGASAFSLPLGTGSQKFELQRDNGTVISATSLREVTDSCACGEYNFNAYVGTVPAGPVDSLDADGLSGFAKGLKGSSCAATPSLTGGGAMSNATGVPGVAAPTGAHAVTTAALTTATPS